jgi:hypothetical protein
LGQFFFRITLAKWRRVLVIGIVQYVIFQSTQVNQSAANAHTVAAIGSVVGAALETTLR